MDDTRVWAFEESLWTGDADQYHTLIDDECVMVLPEQPFVMTGAQAIAFGDQVSAYFARPRDWGERIGAAAEKIAAALGDVPIEQCGAIDAAVREARERARPGDTVLLAPACASFDQFDNFEHRGREFKRLVRALGGS